MKKLTIIIPSYNVEEFVINALESIKKQNVDLNTYEVLVIDDGSSDKTAQLVLQWIEENNFKDIFKFHKKKNGNWGSVINYAKKNKLINGQYVSILDADDYFNEGAFEKVYSIIKENKSYDLIFGNFNRKRGEKIINTKVMFTNKSKEVDKKRSYTAWSIPLCKFFKTEIFINLDDLKEGVSYQDQILFHSFVNKASSFYFINKNLGTYYENRVGSSTAQKWDIKRIELWCSNMNKLLDLQSREVAAYVMMMINHCKKQSSKQLKSKVLISKKYVKLFKSAKFYWLPFGLRWIAKTFFILSTKSIIRNSNKFN